jgi:hypothetical protein
MNKDETKSQAVASELQATESKASAERTKAELEVADPTDPKRLRKLISGAADDNETTR